MEEACRSGNLSAVISLVNSGYRYSPNILLKSKERNIRAAQHKTPLFVSAECGHVELVEYFLNNPGWIIPPKLSISTESGVFADGHSEFIDPMENSFVCILRKRNKDIIHALLDCEHLFIQRLYFLKDEQAEKILFAHPRVVAFQQENKLFMCSMTGDATEARKILSSDNLFNPLQTIADLAANPFVIACTRGHCEVVKVFLEDSRFCIDSVIDKALSNAISIGELEIVKILMENEKIDPILFFGTDKFKRPNAIHVAAIAGKPKILEYLFTLPQAQNIEMLNKIFARSCQSQISSEVIDLFLEKTLDTIHEYPTADLKQYVSQDNYAVITLSAAIRKGSAYICYTLLSKEKFRSAIEDYAFSELSIACIMNDTEKIKEILKDSSVDVNAGVSTLSPLFRQHSPIHFCVLLNHREAFRELFQQADMNVARLVRNFPERLFAFLLQEQRNEAENGSMQTSVPLLPLFRSLISRQEFAECGKFQTLVQFSIENNRVDVLQQVLDRAYDPFSDDQILFSHNNFEYAPEILKVLFKAPYQKSNETNRHKRIQRYLMECGDKDSVDCIRVLIESGGDPLEYSAVGRAPVKSPFWSACEKGCALSLKTFLSYPDVKQQLNMPPIHFAVCIGDLDLVESLLNSDINMTFEGRTPLFLAVCLGYTKIATLLLKQDQIDPNIGYNNNSTFRVALAMKNKKVLTSLFDPRLQQPSFDMIQQAVSYELRRRAPKNLRLLVEERAKTLSEPRSESDKIFCEALEASLMFAFNSSIMSIKAVLEFPGINLLAIHEGNEISAFEKHLTLGKTVNDRLQPQCHPLLRDYRTSPYPCTEVLRIVKLFMNHSSVAPLVPALHAACMEQNKEKIENLLANESPAVLNQKFFNFTACHFAVILENGPILSLLSSCDSVDINAPGPNGRTALQLACTESKNFKLFEVLLHNPSVDLSVTSNGLTPFNELCKQDRVEEIAELFMKHPLFDSGIYNADKKTALWNCKSLKLWGILLADGRIDPSVPDDNGDYLVHQERTPLLEGFLFRLKALLDDERVDPNVIPASGQTVWNRMATTKLEVLINHERVICPLETFSNSITQVFRRARTKDVELMAKCCYFIGMDPEELFHFVPDDIVQLIKDHLLLSRSKAVKE